MKIVIASDHGAVKLKDEIIAFLKTRQIDIKDMGTFADEAVDYPDMAAKACEEFKTSNYAFGILLCGTGIGISIAANKIKGIRCALIGDLFAAEMAKAHNNSNFIAFGGRIRYAVAVSDMIEKFMQTAYEGGRHEKRVAKIMALEETC